MKRITGILLPLLMAVILCGCGITTVDDMYHLPKRSDSYLNLQSAMDSAMSGLEYAAPLAGENQQNVQIADLDGDGEGEYLIFARATEDKPLKILIFHNENDVYTHAATISCNGTAFDQVEYVDMDGQGGLEVVVGRRLSDQLVRSASVYSFAQEQPVQLVSVNYTKMLAVDLDGNAQSELFVLRPGPTDVDKGIAELYSFKDGVMERSNEATMSQQADKLKRVIVGSLDGGNPAIYVASTVDDTAIVTDVYTLREGLLVNAALSNGSGTSIQTMRNFYVYADDIDNDSVVELPALMNMKPLDGGNSQDRHHLIRWYAMTPEGAEVDKMYTFHNFVGGWYVQLDSAWAPRLTVQTVGNQHQFYVWNESYKSCAKVFTITVHSAQERQAWEQPDSFVLYKTESAIYTAKLELAAEALSLTKDILIYSFRLIQQDWKTGET